MKTALFMALCSSLLTGCGGGGDTSATTFPYALKEYSDGSGIIKGATDLGNAGGVSNLIIAATDLPAAKDFIDGAVDLNTISSSEDGKYFTVTRTGITANGTQIQAITEGMRLSGEQGGYVSMSYVTFNSELGLLSAGTQPIRLPSGEFSYSGLARVVTDTEAADGTAIVTANFSSRTVDLIADIPANDAVEDSSAYFFSATAMPMNVSDGSFSTTNALIGEIGTNGNSAGVMGYFAGDGATGVHGMVYNNSDSRTPLGLFIADR